MSPAALQTQWARLLLGSLRQAGVRDVILSPGSRNTPFTFAALREPGLACRSIIDERSAAFFAVGHARVTGRPVLLVCTSGSAAANYWPAVVEAAESGTPLLLLTADRPLELQHSAAPQTIDQVRLYGAFARAYFDLGAPDPHPAMLRALPRIAAQAVLAARHPTPGPVHLNARARKPLEPHEDEGPVGLSAEVDALLERVPVAQPPVATPSAEALDPLARACRGARRGLLVCGPAAPWRAPDPGAVKDIARATGFPVVAEAASQLRFGPHAADLVSADAFETLLALPSFRDHHPPDLVLQVGRPPTASAWGDYLGPAPAPARWVLGPGWSDPWGTATGVLDGDATALLRGLAAALHANGPGAGDPERAAWRDAIARASATARETIEAAVAGAFSEGAAVRAVADRLPEGGILALGNSLPIREADLYIGAMSRRVMVWSQRGANGIDGLVSGAAGAAAGAGMPTALLIGDVSFVHDIGGLAVARDADVPLAIVVLDNGGGRIFDRLPLADQLRGDPAFEAWLTPPRLDVAAAARAFGLRHARVADPETLVEALDRALGEAGATVVEVTVPAPGPVAEERALLRRIEARLDA